MNETPEILIPALRQYRHKNDNSPSLDRPDGGFVTGFDYDETCKVVAGLLELTTVKRAQEIIASLENTLCDRDAKIARLEKLDPVGFWICP